MNSFKALLKLILIMGMAMTISACSKTVQWEEEVLLNTGETIWVKRSGTYSLQLQAGNPFDVRLSPEPISTIEFIYKGKRYVHTGEVALMLLAIAPNGEPNFAALPDSNGWQWKNNYYCTNPSYVQFKPDQQGTQWTWPDKIESWLYGNKTNLIPSLIPLSEDKKKFTVTVAQEMQRSRNTGFPEFQSIDIKHIVTNNCPRRN
jgi:hypothetical protein